MGNKVLKALYVSAFIALMAIPGIWTIFQDKKTIGNEDVKDMSGATYMTFSDKFDDYFSSNFGFRSELVNMNNSFMKTVFNQSGEDSVIIGKNGWLFYQSALHDYIGEDVLSDSDIAKVVKILEISDKYVSQKDSKLIFAVAPNKMEIYGNEMPYYYMEDTSDGNYEKLMKALADSKINFTDLKSVLKKSAEDNDMIIYHKLDSHWNNIGASVAYASIMDLSGLKYTSYDKIPYTVQNNFEGDLYKMLYPDGTEKDDQVWYQVEDNFEYTSNFRAEDDMIIDTENENGSSSVLMFRDSFGNALYSFFARDFSKAEFSRALPYDLDKAEGNDLVVAEIVERNIGNLLLYPPILEAPEVAIDDEAIVQKGTSAQITFEAKGNYNLISISSQDIPSDCVEVYLKNGKNIYEAYPSALKGDACLYLGSDKEVNMKGFTVFYRENNVLYQLESLR